MLDLNLQHLRYFWTVAREGSVTQAAKVLFVTPSTISIQIKKLEEATQQSLFNRVGRGLELTEVGRVAFQYADAMFATGQELQNFLEGRSDSRPQRLQIGVSPIFPKLVTWELMRPATGFDCHIVCREAPAQQLVELLALHQLDVVFCDTPLRGSTTVKMYNRLLGETKVSLYSADSLTEQYAANFPECLNNAPMLLPAIGTQMRRQVDAWLVSSDIVPKIAGEFEDLALLKIAGENGLGVFPVPDIIADAAMKHYRIGRIGPMENVVERFYVATAERRIAHPIVQRIVDRAAGFLEA